MLLLKVTTFKPIRRIILIRFTFSLYITCILMVILVGSTIWINSNCEMEMIQSKNQRNQPESRIFESFQRPKEVLNFNENFQIEKAKSCFVPKNHSIYSGIELLEDVLKSEKRPKPGKSIFFHETSCTEDGIVVLNARYFKLFDLMHKMNHFFFSKFFLIHKSTSCNIQCYFLMFKLIKK